MKSSKSKYCLRIKDIKRVYFGLFTQIYKKGQEELPLLRHGATNMGYIGFERML
jgi:hypothetical protein